MSGPWGCAQGEQRNRTRRGTETAGTENELAQWKDMATLPCFTRPDAACTHPSSRHPGSKGHLSLTNKQTKLLKMEPN